MIIRKILDDIQKNLFKGKTIIIYGPRQSGKTTLLKMISDLLSQKILLLDCDEPDVRKDLTDPTSVKLKKMIGPSKVVMIDEAQRIKNIGLTIKLIHDKVEGVQVIATGSSALELSNKINEPLTGRKFEYLLLPVSTEELINHTDLITEKRLLDSRLLYGMYPDVINQEGSERRILNNLAGSYLYKDIFAFQDVRKPEIIENLLEMLSLQIGSEVSYHELANNLGIDQITVRRYIDLLEKTFVVFRIRAFSRNLRNEIKKSRKIYFYDNGIRNALISDFGPVGLRVDIGALWENFLVSERKKWLNNNFIYSKSFFWRTKQHQEIDYIEESDSIMNAYEFKWSGKKNPKFPLTFTRSYPHAKTKLITSENYMEFTS